jgi:hypothetical protein
MPRVSTCPKATPSTRFGEGVEVRRSPQAGHTGRDESENPEGPIDSWPEGRPGIRYTIIEARKGKPGHRVKRCRLVIWMFLRAGVSRHTSPVLSKKASAFRKAAPSVVNKVYGSGDQADFNWHVDDVHWNPVKHGWVRPVADWLHPSFHASRRRGIYAKGWGGENVPGLPAVE